MKLFRLNLDLPNEGVNMQEYCTDSMDANGYQLEKLMLKKQHVNALKYSETLL